ncbi:MAG: arginine deiminase family protein [Chitinophagales bacterium]|nr:arginine deiminase family protein [Chitinophagales bacterium]
MLGFNINKVPLMDLPKGLLMVSPEEFDVVDVKNPYMKHNIGKINSAHALTQWTNIYKVFQQWKAKGVIETLEVMKARPHLEDMVFCANPFFAFLDSNNMPVVLLSNMRHSRRQAEVSEYRSYFEQHGVRCIEIPDSIKIEGNGDLIPHPKHRLIWMGYGYRTDIAAADILQDALQAYIIPLRLVSEHFYHLDTCFCIIDDEHVAICRSAFDESSYLKIKQIFPFVYEISEKEAREKFSLNALVMSHQNGKKYALVPQGADEMQHLLISLDVEVNIVDTQEFIKSGGSIYCMKGFLYA